MVKLIFPELPEPPQKNFLYKVQTLQLRLVSQIVRAFWKVFRLRPGSEPYLTGDTFRRLCAYRWDEAEDNCPFDFGTIRTGDLVYVAGNRVEQFFRRFEREALPPMVLITGNDDTNITEKLFLARPSWVGHWFAQNVLFRHPDLTPLPIGLENRKLHWHGRIDDFKRLSRSEGIQWPVHILYGFAVGNNPVERNPAMEVLKALDWAFPSGNLNSWNYRRYLRKFGLVASPPGNGEDCHRTWEALYLGVAPVVKRSVLSEFFQSLGLALVTVESWEEMKTWSREFRESRATAARRNKNHPALFLPFWKDKIVQVQKKIIDESKI